MKSSRWMANAALAAVFATFSAAALAANTPTIDTRVEDALNRFYAQGENHRELAHRAAAVLVFPRVTKAGVAVGGEFGEGALLVHGKTVGYYAVTGASVGATLGVARRSEVILFMTDAALDRFTQSREWTAGADTGVAFMHKGAGGQYDTQTLNKPVLAFVFGEQGIIADASLQGAKISKLKE